VRILSAITNVERSVAIILYWGIKRKFGSLNPQFFPHRKARIGGFILTLGTKSEVYAI